MKENLKPSHNKIPRFFSNIREFVFGAQDGMVSPLGAISGIAIGSSNHFFVILSGFVVVAVEATSMGIGAYFSTKSVIDIARRRIKEEKAEYESNKVGEIKELADLYVKEGWSPDTAAKMAIEASKKKDLFLREMVYMEHGIKKNQENPLQAGIIMFFSYVLGGAIPVLAYLFFPIYLAMTISILITLFSLFLLGFFVAKFTGQNMVKAGLRMLLIAGIAVAVGLIVGNSANFFFTQH